MDDALTDAMKVEASQRAFCRGRGVEFVPTPLESKSGFAFTTRGLMPINGMRHAVEGETSGWYIWCGEKFSDLPEFFAPVCIKHIIEDYPKLTELFGLPPGHRFLMAGEYLDVWFDVSLLNG